VIHATAIVEPGAKLGAGCEIHAYAIVKRHAVLGERVVVHPFAVVGGDPQYLKFDSSLATEVRVGAGTVIREHVTLNRSIHAGGFTSIGENCFSDGELPCRARLRARRPGDSCDNAMLGRSCRGGRANVCRRRRGHPSYCRIGEGVMVAGNASITRDLPISRWSPSATK